MSKTKTKAALEAELKYVRKQQKANNFAAVLTHLITWVGISVLGFFLYRSVDALAGEQTTADIGLKLVGNLKLSEVFAYLFGGGGVAYGVQQKRLRKDEVERLQDRVIKLETAIDPKRSSSGLTDRSEESSQMEDR